MTSTGRIDQSWINSRALRGNLIGDPAERRLFVYLPPGYDEHPDRRYPVVLMLSSHGNTAQSLLSWKAWGESIDQQVERLIVSGACAPHIMIIPDTWTSFGGPLHVNNLLFGNYAEYLFDEIIPYVDAHYRTLASGAHRAVIGRSSGGFAAIYHAMTRPGVFSAVADHSGDAYFEYMALPELARLHRHLAKYSGLDGLIAESKKLTQKDQAFVEAVSILTWASSFAPNPDAPFGFDMPIDLETGALLPDVWNRCLQSDPVRMLDYAAHEAALRNLKELFIDCGQFDEYNLQVGARLISRKLRQLGVPHTYEEYPGGHRGTHYRYDVSLPRLVKAIELA